MPLIQVPGLGENFVGYPVTAITVLFAVFSNLSLALIYNEKLARDYMRDVILYSVMGGSAYLYSILDSVLQAKSDFLYPVPIELSFGGAAGYTSQEELGLSAVTGTSDSLFFLGYASIAVRSRPLYFSLELQFSDTPLWIMLDTILRYPVLNNIFIGAGASLYTNLGNSSDVQFSNVSEIVSKMEPLPGDFVLPQLMLSYESARIEGDMMLSPIAFGRGRLFTYQSGSNWTENRFVGGLRGYAAKINLSYFINLKFGLNVSFLYINMNNSDDGLETGNYARINSLQYMNGYCGLVFRF